MAAMSEILGPGGVISHRLPGYESRPTQVAMAETVATALDTGRHAVIEGGTGVGKALDVDTPIATPTGWKRMGDLCAGDMVFEVNGVKCFVDPMSSMYLLGVEVDYVEGQFGQSGFSFKNPNAKHTCGCGSSFSA